MLPAISQFNRSTFELSPWDGLGTEGQLVARELRDGDPLTQESCGSASLLPSVLLAKIICNVSVPVVTFSKRLASEDDDRAEFEKLVSQISPAPDAEMCLPIRQEWSVYLVLGPGETLGGSLRLGVVLEGHDLEPNFIGSAIYRPPSQAGGGMDYGFIFDEVAWDAHPLVSLLRDNEAVIYWLHEAGARDLLALVGSPGEFRFVRSLEAPGSSDVEIVPQVGTGGFTDTDPRTLEGILDANVKYQSGDENIVSKLFSDARERIVLLDRHLAQWRAEYLQATDRFERLRHEP